MSEQPYTHDLLIASFEQCEQCHEGVETQYMQDYSYPDGTSRRYCETCCQTEDEQPQAECEFCQHQWPWTCLLEVIAQPRDNVSGEIIDTIASIICTSCQELWQREQTHGDPQTGEE